MKTLLSCIIALTIGLTAHIAGAIAPGESLDYRVMFKWGMVNKQAGVVNLSTSRAEGDKLGALLTARSAKWADAVYSVRDTLRGVISASDYQPVFYEKISHEGGHFKHDRLTYTRSGNHVKADCVRLDQKNSKSPLTESQITLEAEGLTLDMLSSFYYMRSLDYQRMSQGESRTLTVFSGTKKETLTITYVGLQQVKLGNDTHEAYAIRFRFTGKGGTKTSDDMLAWISTAPDRIPLKLVGKLPVGQVQCYYIPTK